MKKVVVIQQNPNDCGIACVLSIIRYFGGNVSTNILKKHIMPSNDGISALDIVNLLKEYGFEANGYKVSFEELNKLKLPVIIHLNMDNKYFHFAVLYKIKKQGFLIMDPSSGMKEIPYDEFNKIFTNVVILSNPKSIILNIKDSKTIQEYFKKALLYDHKLILKSIYISCLLLTFGILSNLYLKVALNSITSDNTFTNIKNVTIIFVIILVFKLICGFIKEYYENYINKNINTNITIPFLNHLYHIPLYSLKSRNIGDTLTKTLDLELLKEYFYKVYIGLMLDTTFSILVIIILLNINLLLTKVVLLMIILYLINAFYRNNKIKEKIKKQMISENRYNEYLVETLGGIVSIKNSNRLTYFMNNFWQKINDNIGNKYNLNLAIGINDLVIDIINDFGLLIINCVGIKLISQGNLSIINLVLFNSISLYALNTFKNIASIVPKISLFNSSFDRINDLLNIEEEIDYTSKHLLSGKIIVKNLEYSFNHTDKIFSNISLEINKNDKVFISGRSGIGKSTLCKIIAGYITNYQGQILLNNINISDYDHALLHSSISYISQDEVLFNDTIRNNILLGEEISEDFFNKVCNICMIEPIVSNKPFRYETMILESGSNLSGGEKQRIILARSLVGKFSILIMDEALSETNYQMEYSIIKNILKNYKNKTIIYVSHRHNDLFNKIIDLGKLANE